MNGQTTTSPTRPTRLHAALLLVLALVLAACGASEPTDTTDTADAPDTPDTADTQDTADTPDTPDTDDPQATADDAGDISVAIVLNGELGDEAFFDSAARGAAMAEEEHGVEVRVIEAGLDAAGWEPALRSAVASGDHDLVITGTQPMAEILGPIAEEFPDQQFVFYDAALDAPNIHSITYAQHEGSFLAGALAALTTTSAEIEGTNPDATIGFIGGLDLPVINDFLNGFTQGAQYVDSSVEVLSAYAGDFGDPARGLELASTQIAQGADVIYQVAGGTGAGVFQAATDAGTYAIGVDTNQNGIAPGTILSSMMKNVDVSLAAAIGDFAAGDLAFGTTEVYGLANGGVGLATDELYEDHVPADIRERIEEITQELLAGEITVESILGQ
ncbi:BMP family lipoprotein [Euzebya rosea]|uniref:BMP family lipoprotein n=1 Tax=Euzebya rosea TaxID=2052804 RepID=UPI000D3E270D|nr:BMP family ABC transporter substrate-binding protein [Euzebya rosea]